MQKCVHTLGDHQTKSCLVVISYKCFKFKNGWRDASFDWFPRRTCFRGISLLAQIFCLRERQIWAVKIKSFSAKHRLQRDGLPLYALAYLMMRQLISSHTCFDRLSEKSFVLTYSTLKFMLRSICGKHSVMWVFSVFERELVVVA